MALLLPLVWEQWMQVDRHDTTDDPLPLVGMLGGVPGYALDQFTRVGNAISRALLRADPKFRLWLDEVGIRAGMQPRAVGDLLFLIEGGLVRRRACWALGDKLRQPWRCLGSTAIMQDHVAAGINRLRQRASQIAQLRAQYLQQGG